MASVRSVLHLCAYFLVISASPLHAQTWEYTVPAQTGNDDGTNTAHVKVGPRHSSGFRLNLETGGWTHLISVDPIEGATEIWIDVISAGRVETTLFPLDELRVFERPENRVDVVAIDMTDEDLELYMSADLEQITIGRKRYNFPLKGSRKAISQLQNDMQDYRLALWEDTDDQHTVAQLISDCDQQAAHPWDGQNNMDFGVPWHELEADVAIYACLDASDLAGEQDKGRMLYQLGRAFDKAGDDEAIYSLLDAAENHDYSMAQFHLGKLYEAGRHTQKDLVISRSYFGDAVKKGNRPAIHIVAQDMLADESGEHVSLAHQLLERNALMDYPLSQDLYGREIMRGRVEGRAPDEALYFLRRASESGMVDATKALAEIYGSGLGVDVSYSLQLQFLERAAEQEDLNWGKDIRAE